MKNYVIFTAMVALTSGCTTLGQMNCSQDQIAKYDGAKWHCAADATSAANGTSQGLIWLNHHDMVVSPTEGVMLSTNGTVVFVNPKTTGSFPKNEMVGIFTPTLPPGHYITGMRVCYGIIGNHADTEVHRLRLTQYESVGATSGSRWPAYLVRMEDTSTGSLAPNPPAGGFAYNDPAGFTCVDSTSAGGLCLDPAKGTIGAHPGFQFGNADERIAVMAIGLHYDRSCTPN